MDSETGFIALVAGIVLVTMLVVWRRKGWGGEKGVRNHYLKYKLCAGIHVWETIISHVRGWSVSRASSYGRAW
jgi:tetrahydromethanopterin S-methyltransferase subunit E